MQTTSTPLLETDRETPDPLFAQLPNPLKTAAEMSPDRGTDSPDSLADFSVPSQDRPATSSVPLDVDYSDDDSEESDGEHKFRLELCEEQVDYREELHVGYRARERERYLLPKKRARYVRAKFRNDVEDPHTRVQITETNTFTTHMSGRIAHIEFGTFHDVAACLIILKFKFHPFAASTGTRFKSARISARLSFPPSSSASSSASTSPTTESWRQPHPKILRWAPELAYGELTTELTRWQWNIAIPLGTSPAASPTPSLSHEREYHRGHRATVTGSSFGRYDNAMLWTVEESKFPGDGVRGIPRIIQTAMIVANGGKVFHADFSVSASVGFTLDPLHWVNVRGTRDDKCVFTPGYDHIPVGGTRLGVGGVLDDVDLAALTGFSSAGVS